jgi:hypothetical protein
MRYKSLKKWAANQSILRGVKALAIELGAKTCDLQTKTDRLYYLCYSTDVV